MNDNKPRTIRAVERASEVIHLLEEEGGLTLSEISNEINVSKSTVHTYLKTLSREKFIAKHGDEYRLSLRYLSLSERVKSRISLYDQVKSEVKSLAERTEERAQFSMFEENKIVYIYRAKGTHAIPTVISIGQYAYPHSTASGKATLAFLPEHRVDEVIEENGLPQQTENTITDPEELKAHLDKVRERGFAYGNSERLRGVRCIGTPIQDDSGSVLGAISLSGPVRRMTDEKIEDELKDQLLQAANVIEVKAKVE